MDGGERQELPDEISNSVSVILSIAYRLLSHRVDGWETETA